jgi:hypothetical protein
MTRAALPVARQIERLRDLFAQFRSLAEDRPENVWRGVGETGKIIVACDPEYVIQEEQNLVDRSLIDRH